MAIKTKIVAFLVIVLMSTILGIFTGVKNSSDYQIPSFEYEEISGPVEVYRDQYGVPTIIAENEHDLFFAQGYEMARDRLWQLEFFRSVSNGELTRLFGEIQLDADKYLKTLTMKVAAEIVEDKMDPVYIDILEPFVEGINKYIDLHLNNLPLEFELLGVEPKNWEVADVLAMQGVLSRTLSIAHLNDELFRNRLLERFGPERALELYPMHTSDGESYYRSLSQSDAAPIDTLNFDISNIIGFSPPDVDDGSNNWVVGPERSASGQPILANDPHLALNTPGIWWQVHLYAPTYHVSGYSIPGTPGIVIGHNDYVTWGVTNTGLDAVDVFYFKTNGDGSQYWLDGEWKSFTTRDYTFEVSDGDNVDYSVRYTEYGPVLDPEIFAISDTEGLVWVMRWALLEGYDRDLAFKAILDYNRATNMNEFLDALEYFANPGQNYVFATVDGDYGYQFTGIVPIRKTPGSGVLPQNGSDPSFGWNGTIPYSQQYRVVNEETGGYFATANEQIDTRDNFYINSLYAHPYRGLRINTLLEADDQVTKADMQRIQGDTIDLYAVDVLDATLDMIKSGVYNDDLSDDIGEAKKILSNWKGNMDRDESGPTIFQIYRVFLERHTFRDELNNGSEELNFDSSYFGRADWGIISILNDENSVWWDDITTNKVETMTDIVHKAFEKAVEYLTEKISGNSRNWIYGNVHEVNFAHPMGGVSFLGVLNEGGIPSDGSEFSVKAAGGSLTYSDGEIGFIQAHGSSMRYIAEAESTWSNVWGIVVPGESEHFFHGQRGNSVEDWVNNVLHEWDYSVDYSREPDFTYIKI